MTEFPMGPPQEMREEKGFIEKAKGFLLSPTETLRAVRPDTLGDCLKYALIWFVIFGALFGIIFAVMFTVFLAMLPIPLPGWLAGLGLGLAGLIFVMVILFGIVGLIIGGAWQHLWVYVCGGRKGYTQTVKALAYGATPSFVLGWIPFLGIIGAIWAIVVTILGLRELHEISTGRAVAAYLLSIVMLWVILAIVLLPLMLAGLAR